jgi:polyribonucleotide nucleotidyltransferase
LAYHKIEREIFGHKWALETGKMAKQADGAVIVTMGETVVLSAVQSADPRPGIDFFPLTVDYRERTAAAGKFPGGFFKREGRPTQKEILTMRLTDRHIRPLFADGYNDEVQIMNLVLSADNEHDPDILAMIGSSAALSISKIPFPSPTGAVRVGFKDGEYIVNPSAAEREASLLDLVVAGTQESVCMVEAGSRELSEDQMLGAISKGHEFIKEMTAMIAELVEKAGVPKKEVEPPDSLDDLFSELEETSADKVRECILVPGKHAKKKALKEFCKEYCEARVADIDDEEEKAARAKLLKKVVHDYASKRERRMIVEEEKRADSRGLRDIRQIDIETGILPRTHGSALFTRGETQAIVTLTLGTSSNAQLIEGLDTEYYQKFMLHYTFPPYCVGEVKPIRGPGRREIGHGALAERGIAPVLPSPDDFCYTIRIASDILESNGSSSMASVCGGCLALMDGGVPIERPVAGIAMGLILEGEKVRILSDILGSEDHNGDMDFKVVGTEKGITALQMDIKIKGITIDIMNDALGQAREGRIHILRCMTDAIDKPREIMSPYAPKMLRKVINPEKIGTLIGPGGRMIKKIQEDANVKIDVDDSGEVLVSGPSQAAVERGLAMVQAVTEDVEIGKIYKGKVVSIKDFGVFLEILPGQEGLCHVSELSENFVKTVSDVVGFGEIHDVKVINIDDAGRIKLSIKQAKSRDSSPSKGPDRR